MILLCCIYVYYIFSFSHDNKFFCWTFVFNFNLIGQLLFHVDLFFCRKEILFMVTTKTNFQNSLNLLIIEIFIIYVSVGILSKRGYGSNSRVMISLDKALSFWSFVALVWISLEPENFHASLWLYQCERYRYPSDGWCFFLTGHRVDCLDTTQKLIFAYTHSCKAEILLRIPHHHDHCLWDAWCEGVVMVWQHQRQQRGMGPHWQDDTYTTCIHLPVIS